MFAGFKIRNITLIPVLALLVLLVPGPVFAATMDPLLRSLVRDKAAGAAPGLNYERFLAIDASVNPADPMVGVILHLDGGGMSLSALPSMIIGSRMENFVTARIPLSSLPLLEADDDINHVEAAVMLHPMLDLAVPDGRVDGVWVGEPAYTGSGVLIGIIDSGLDWNHDDFKTESNDTRIKFIWDQFVSGTHPTGYNYGAEYSEAFINAGSLTEVDLSGHGTHVTGIAAGNGRAGSMGQYKGVAPEADIIFVKAFDDDLGGFPQDKVIDAMVYLAEKASALGQPMAINMSLGGHMGPHDGTSAQEQIIDQLSGAGLVFCVAAGNEGEGSVHHSGPAWDTELIFNIPAYTEIPGLNNDYVLVNIWVDGGSTPTVSVSQGGVTTGPVATGSRTTSTNTHGYVLIDNAYGGIDPSNNDQQIVIQIDDSHGNAPGSGDWKVTLSGGSGTAHAWIATSTMEAGFSGSDQTYSVAMPATAEAAISVAAHKTRQSWIGRNNGAWQYPLTSTLGQAEIGDHAPFSSNGPTRDGREKPDISAPGAGIFAPYSADTDPYPGDPLLSPDGNYLLSQGTSMASPFVCGVVALMMEKDPTLSADQIRTALRESAATDDYTGEVWNNRFGAGKVDAQAAMEAIEPLGPPPTGDVNADEVTTVLDLVLLALYIADPTGHPLDSEALIQGDVYPVASGDGLLNASDLARIVAFILESDEPGYTLPVFGPVQFEVGPVQWQDGRWWQPVTILGEGVTAGQFALNLDGAAWQTQDLICESPVQVTAGSSGSQLRVLLYDLGGEFPADGVTMLVPFDFPGEEPGSAGTAGILMVDSAGSPLAIQETSLQPMGFLRVTPNPAPGDMLVSFARGSGRQYDLSVFDLRGRRVRGIRRGRGNMGTETVVFDGRDDGGRQLPTGVYFVRLRSGDRVLSQKVLLTR